MLKVDGAALSAPDFEARRRMSLQFAVVDPPTLLDAHLSWIGSLESKPNTAV